MSRQANVPWVLPPLPPSGTHPPPSLLAPPEDAAPATSPAITKDFMVIVRLSPCVLNSCKL